MKVPVVVIVGRPNVGKSTLFNRLIGKREAIVDKVSGVTRDRNYGQVEWCGKIFTLIDTGGFVPESENIFEKAIAEQIEYALLESDYIIFLVDGYDGITPVDREIANRLRKSKKNIYLVVNKIDDENKEINSSDFYELQLGEPITISAQAGRKIGDFLDLLTNDFPLNADLKETKSKIPKIAIVGRPNVGKSSLVNALIGTEKHIVTDIPGTTRDSIDTDIKYYGKTIKLIDTAGLRKKSKIKENIEFYSVLRSVKAIEESDVVILLLDATLGIEKQDLNILSLAIDRKKGIIIGINKWDLIEKDSKTARQFELSLREKLGEYDYIPMVFISCLTKQRITKLLEYAFEIYEERKKKLTTSSINNFLEDTFRNVSLPSSSTGKEVKIKYGTQLKTAPPVFALFTNDPKSIQEHTKRFIENKFRENFGFVGVPLTIIYKNKNR